MIDFSTIRQRLRPGEVPELKTINGVGTTIVGSYQPPTLSPLEFKFVCYCLLFVPLAPLGIYLVKEDPPDSYAFYGRLPLRDFLQLFGGRDLLFFALSVLLGTLVKILALAGAAAFAYYVAGFLARLF